MFKTQKKVSTKY